MSIAFETPTQAIHDALEHYPTPFHLYDVATLRRATDRLYGAMEKAGVDNFQNFFAVKALPNPHILRQLVAMGHGLDCSSVAELQLARQLGLSGEQVIFTSNNTSVAEFAAANELGAIINFDDTVLVQRYIDEFGAPEVASCRYNPGELSVDSESVQKFIGRPAEAKFGMGKAEMIKSYRLLKESGTTRFGLHTMLLSSNLNWENHAEVARLLFELANDISLDAGITFEFIDLGGGIGVPYEPEDTQFDYDAFARTVRENYDNAHLERCGSPRIVMENGRSIAAEAGWLVSRVRTVKRSHKTYIGLDASMVDLMRPAMHGAYHHITALDPRSQSTQAVDVVGSLCVNSDKFAIDRELPELEEGDVLVIHTTGAHGHSAGFTYNGRPRSAELMCNESGDVMCIRRAETIDDLFATIVPLEETV